MRREIIENVIHIWALAVSHTVPNMLFLELSDLLVCSDGVYDSVVILLSFSFTPSFFGLLSYSCSFYFNAAENGMSFVNFVWNLAFYVVSIIIIVAYSSNSHMKMGENETEKSTNKIALYSLPYWIQYCFLQKKNSNLFVCFKFKFATKSWLFKKFVFILLFNKNKKNWCVPCAPSWSISTFLLIFFSWFGLWWQYRFLINIQCTSSEYVIWRNKPYKNFSQTWKNYVQAFNAIKRIIQRTTHNKMHISISTNSQIHIHLMRLKRTFHKIPLTHQLTVYVSRAKTNIIIYIWVNSLNLIFLSIWLSKCF